VKNETPFKYKDKNNKLQKIEVNQHQTILIHMVYYIYSFDSIEFNNTKTLYNNMKNELNNKNFDGMKVAYDRKVNELRDAGTILGFNWSKYDNNFKNDTDFLGEIIDTYDLVKNAFNLNDGDFSQLDSFLKNLTTTVKKDDLTKLLNEQKMDQFSIFFFGNSEKVEKELDTNILPKPMRLDDKKFDSAYQEWLNEEAKKILSTE
jgi:hypothetical protein